MHTSVEGNDTKKRDNTQDEDSDRSRQTIASPHIKKPQGVIAQTPVRKWNRRPNETHTSSTAKGGGGSFKNRKPIGEVGCCESGMAERSHWWIERWLISRTFSLSFSDYLSIDLFIYLSIYLAIYISSYLSIHLSVYLSICLPVYLPICLSIYLSICLSIYLSICLSICLSVYLSICGAVSFSVV